MKRKRYTDEFRAATVIMLEASGYPTRKGALQEVSNHVGVAAMTISRWFHATSNPPPNEIVIIKKEEIVKLMIGEVHAAILEMAKARQDADYKDLATAAAILTDKWQLLSGDPTERIATQHEYTDSERANEIEKLLDDARARATGLASIPSEAIH